MNINQDPLSRRESTLPPSREERAAMRATRDKVRTDQVQMSEGTSRRESARRVESAAPKGDRIEISVEARERMDGAKETSTDRREMVMRLREAYQNGELNTDSRREAAAQRMLGGESEM